MKKKNQPSNKKGRKELEREEQMEALSAIRSVENFDKNDFYNDIKGNKNNKGSNKKGGKSNGKSNNNYYDDIENSKANKNEKKRSTKEKMKGNKNIKNLSKKQRLRQNREHLQVIAEQNYSSFGDDLAKLGLMIRTARGDGNCLFRSVCDQLEGHQNNYDFYRQEACKYMIDNKDFYQNYIEDDQTFDDYIAEMIQDGEWGGNLELQAMSMKFQVNFYIHIFQHPMLILHNFDNPKKELHLSYHEGQHYNSLRLLDDTGDTIPKKISLDGMKCESTTEYIDYDLLNATETDTNEQNNGGEDEDQEIIGENNDNEDDELERALAESKLNYENETKIKETQKTDSNNIKENEEEIIDTYNKDKNENIENNENCENIEYDNDYRDYVDNCYDINYYPEEINKYDDILVDTTSTLDQNQSEITDKLDKITLEDSNTTKINQVTPQDKQQPADKNATTQVNSEKIKILVLQIIFIVTYFIYFLWWNVTILFFNFQIGRAHV